MVQGRKAIPANCKPENEQEIEFEIPECPDWLTGLARDEWNRCIPLLSKFKLLNPVDQVALAAYCHTYQEWRNITEELKISGVVFMPLQPTNMAPSARPALPKLNPAAKYSQQLLQQLLQFARHFGFTPGGRGMMKIKPQEDREDSLSNFLENEDD